MRERTLQNVGEESGETPQDLADALADLADACEEAREEGFPIPDRELLTRAEGLLRKLYVVWPHRFEVYPDPDGSIVIDAPNRMGSSILLFCEPEGGALCLVHIEGKQWSKRYPSCENLPDEFLTDAFGSLFMERG